MKVFLSYSHSDKKFVTKLAKDLRDRGVVPWFDEWEMSPGDSLSRRIQEGIEESSMFLVILSSTSLSSRWCQKELDAADMIEVKKGRKFVIPVLYEECQLPPFIRAKMYADFSSDYDNGLKKLIKALPITNYRELDVQCPHCGAISRQRIRKATVAEMEHKPDDCKKCGIRYFIHISEGETGYFTTKTDTNDYGIHPTKGLELIDATRWALRKKQAWVPPKQLGGMIELMKETEGCLIRNNEILTPALLLSAMIKSDNIALYCVTRQSVRMFITVLQHARYFIGEKKKRINFKDKYTNPVDRDRVVEGYVRGCLFKLKTSGVISNTEDTIKVTEYLLSGTGDNATEIAVLVSKLMFGTRKIG